MNTVVQAYRYALDPTSAQQAALRSHCGAQRYAYNWGLARIKANLDQRRAEGTYGLGQDELVPLTDWSAYSLRKEWDQVKDMVAPWWSENSKESYSSGLVDADHRHIKLPRIGVVRTCESTRTLARHVGRGAARIRSATVSLRSGRWFVAFSVEIARDDPGPTRPHSVVGVDLGVKSRTRTAPSSRWRKTRARIARLHVAVANQRRDGLHKLSTRLVHTYGTVVIEDLNVSGMLRNRRLARHVAGVGMAELRRQLEYKAAWAGTRLHIADRWFPSSKTCSACGAVKAKLRLSERTFHCDRCGLVLDRDLNAARNLAALVEASSPSCGATRNEPDGNPRQTRSTRATGIATGRPASTGAGQRQRSNPLAQLSTEELPHE